MELVVAFPAAQPINVADNLPRGITFRAHVDDTQLLAVGDRTHVVARMAAVEDMRDSKVTTHVRGKGKAGPALLAAGEGACKEEIEESKKLHARSGEEAARAVAVAMCPALAARVGKPRSPTVSWIARRETSSSVPPSWP